MNYFVIGDVHGEYQALLNLIAKIPKHGNLIFVGDLIDRGMQSAHVVRFVRTNKIPCVMGNHEVMMIEYGSKFIKDVKEKKTIDQDNIWLKHGGKETLLSYGLVSINNNNIELHPFIREFIFQFEDDIKWMKGLPLYLELDTYHASRRKIIVSHSAIAPVWNFKKSSNLKEVKKFNDTVLWGRAKPQDNEEIFNIFGHTPQQYSAEIKKHYVNVDTGCYMKDDKGYGLLSAYCVETNEVYSSTALAYDKVS